MTTGSEDFTIHSARRLLIVEDEFLLALDVEDTARDAGYDVVGIAVDLSSAMTLANKAEIALVDLNLRDGLTGPEIGRRLIETYGVAVVFLTANPDMLKDLGIPAHAILSKPCRPETLFRTLATIPERRDASERQTARAPAHAGAYA